MTTPRNQTSGSTSKSKTKAPLDAIEMLKEDHRKVEELFAAYEKEKNNKKKWNIVDQICTELTVHAQLEETSFYPLVQEALGEEEASLVDEASVEHASLKWLIEQLQREDVDAPLHEAKVTVLKEYVAHHVKEEEKEMFPKVKKSDIDIVELAETLRAAREKIISKLTAN